jgi:hypothetical protein
MKKTKKHNQQHLTIYMEGRKAAQEGKPRFAPYPTEDHAQMWFAGFDSVNQFQNKP